MIVIIAIFAIMFNAVGIDSRMWDLTCDGHWKILEYTFIEGGHSPNKISQFRGICKGLKIIHDLGYVHGDIRLSNMIFGENKSQLIDFDMSRRELNIYPFGYRMHDTFQERHAGAQYRRQMLKMHDVHSLQYIMNELFPLNSLAEEYME